MPIPQDQIDPDAAKVVRRLARSGFAAYLVGGCVRDLLLGRKPKDFDVATSATPPEIKPLFRNCRIIGRRFRLAHIFFGPKIIETVHLPRQPARGRGRRGRRRLDADGRGPRRQRAAHPPRQRLRHRRGGRAPPRLHHQRPVLRPRGRQGHRLRRGAARSRARAPCAPSAIPTSASARIRSASCARSSSPRGCDFDIEPATYAAMLAHKGEIAKCAPPRVLEEIYRLLRGGAARRSLELLQATGVSDRARSRAAPASGAARATTSAPSG